MLTINGHNIDCVESGEGPAVLFLPGSYSTPAAWRPVQRLLGPGRRMVTASLCGYGGTTETRTKDDYGMHHEVQLVEALARHIGQPVHLVGHSFGGTIALAAALSGTVKVASLSLFEGNPIALIETRDGGLVYQDTLRMSREFDAAVAGGERDAPRRIIDFWGGAGVFDAMPEAVQAYCRQTVAANALDWKTVFEFAVPREDLAALDIPVLLVRGAFGNPAMVQITEVLRESLPDVQGCVVEGAGHFLVTTHAAQCAQLLEAFLGRVAPPAR